MLKASNAVSDSKRTSAAAALVLSSLIKSMGNTVSTGSEMLILGAGVLSADRNSLVKEAFDIGLHHIVDLVCHDRLVDIPHYVVR